MKVSSLCARAPVHSRRSPFGVEVATTEQDATVVGDFVRIAILSDLHLSGSRFALPDLGADVAVLAGDIDDGRRGIEWANEAFDCPVVYVLGNHEYRGSSIEARLAECRAAAAPHVHVLEQDCVTINSVRFLGATLWSNCTLFGALEQRHHQALAAEQCADFRLTKSRTGELLSIAEVIEIHERTREWLACELSIRSDPTVVVTHHAPSPLSLPPHLFSAPLVATYATDLRRLMGKASFWIHGHVHSSSNYEIDGTHVICNPRGPAGASGIANKQFDQHLVIPVRTSNRRALMR